MGPEAHPGALKAAAGLSGVNGVRYAQVIGSNFLGGSAVALTYPPSDSVSDARREDQESTETHPGFVDKRGHSQNSEYLHV